MDSTNASVVIGIGDEIEVSDLTIDCNRNAQDPGQANGVVLFGNREAIRRVRCIKSSATLVESFVLACDRGMGNIIEECEVSETYGFSQLSAITLNSSTNGIIRNNRVLGDGDTNKFICAYNHAESHGILVEGNVAEGVAIGFYGDTGNFRDGIIAHNQFSRVTTGGIFLNLPGATNNSAERYDVIHNTISLTPEDLATGYNKVGIGFYDGETRDLKIVGNRVICTAATNAIKAYGVQFYSASNTLVTGNTLPDNLKSGGAAVYLPFRNNVTVMNNFNNDGRLLNTYQVEPANALTRREVNNSTTINYDDKYIGVKAGAAVTISLPVAYFAGKDFIICDEKGNAGTFNITVSPAAWWETIDGGASKIINANYGALSVICDGTNWFVYSKK